MAVATLPDPRTVPHGLDSEYWRPVRIQMARESPFALAEYCFQDSRGQPLIEADFHEEWHHLWQSAPQAVIVGPRGHGKTENLQAFILWTLGHNPNTRIKYLSADPDLARAVLGSIRQHIEQNERLAEVFNLRPDRKAEWSKHRLFIKRPGIGIKDASLEAWGVTQGRTGGRCDLLIGDDVCNWRNTIGQPALRKAVKNAWREAWMKQLDQPGRVIYTATPWSTDDLTADFAPPSWQVWRRPALNEQTLKVLWPERFDAHYFLRLLNDPKEGPAARRQYQLIAASDQDTTFSSTLIDGIFDFALTTPSVEPAWLVCGGVDLARSQSEEASFSVMITAAILPDGRRVLLDIQRGQFLPVPTWEMIITSWERWHHHLNLVENNAYQEAAVDYIHRKEPAAAQAIQGFTTGRQKADQELGLPGMAGRLPLWTVPMGDMEHPRDESGHLVCTCERCVLMNELKVHPFGDHSDCVMALWFADTAAEQLRRVSAPMEFGVSSSRRMAGSEWMHR